MTMMVRGVRGATTVTENTKDAIVAATEELLRAMIDANGIEEDTVASIIFTCTPDLDAAYPAQATRRFGWRYAPLMGCQEMNVPGGLTMCIRVLLHWNTIKGLREINHVYLHDAVALRPDLVEEAHNISLNS